MKSRRNIVTEKEIRDITAMKESGKTGVEIAKEIGRTPSFVSVRLNAGKAKTMEGFFDMDAFSKEVFGHPH